MRIGSQGAWSDIQAIKNQFPADQESNRWDLLPGELWLHIFTYLNSTDLPQVRLICRLWNLCAQHPSVVKSVYYRDKKMIYKTFAFGKKDWVRCGGADLVIDEDEEKEISSLPNNIIKILNSSCPLFPGKKVRETHMLFRIPKGLSIKKIGQLAKRYFPDNKKGFRGFIPVYNKEVDCSYWALMTMDVLPESTDKCYADQQAMVSLVKSKDLETGSPMYMIPTALEASCGIFTKHFATLKANDLESGIRLFKNKYICCQDTVLGFCHATVGIFTQRGLNFYFIYQSCSVVGVAALRKF